MISHFSKERWFLLLENAKIRRWVCSLLLGCHSANRANPCIYTFIPVIISISISIYIKLNMSSNSQLVSLNHMDYSSFLLLYVTFHFNSEKPGSLEGLGKRSWHDLIWDFNEMVAAMEKRAYGSWTGNWKAPKEAFAEI